MPPRVYADFLNLDDLNRVRLTCAGTLDDLTRQGIPLQEGLVLTLYSDDAQEDATPDELQVNGLVHYDAAASTWVAAVDWATIRHVSEQDRP